MQTTVLAATRRDGASGDDVPPSPVAKRRMDDAQATSARAGAHFVVGRS